MGTSFRSLALSTAISLALTGAGIATMGVAQAVVPNAERSATKAAQASEEAYIITFVEAGLINYEGGIPGLARTAPEGGRARRLDRTTTSAKQYEAFLEAQRQSYLASIQAALGRPLDVTHSYGITFNGIAANLTAEEAKLIAAMPGVESARPAGVFHLDTYRGPAFIGAEGIWNGDDTPTGIGNRGQGVKVGIIDSGANTTHPSFANDASCGFSAGTPKIIAKDCSSSSGGLCTGSSPQAASGNGHGVHTASTVAGNTIDNTASPAPALPDGVEMSGVAPCAQVYSYLVCGSSTCSGTWIAAGIQNAIADGVDVINFSISGGTSPWSDNDRSFLDAVGNGTLVVASAGNNSSADPTVIGKVNHRGPWVTSVAASTHDRVVGPSMSVVGPGTPPESVQNIALTFSSTTTAAMTPVLAGKPIKAYAANIAGCTATGGFPAGYFNNSIAVVRRGASVANGEACAFTEKATNAYNAGAEVVVIANNAVGQIVATTTGAPSIPIFTAPMTEGDALISFLASHPDDSTANLSPLGTAAQQGDVLADFSYRGPTPGNLVDLTKPDITAPGVNIYAATDPGSGQYEYMSGTSMSGPHVAGAGALMVAVHPDWSPMEIRSALMTTAKRDGYQEDGVTPWNIDDVGSGRVNVADAALAGLTMDETKANFLAANPSGGSINVKQLNIPSLRNLSCVGACSWTRTFKNRLSVSGSWNVASVTNPSFTISASPSSFTLAPNAEQQVTFTATPQALMSDVTFGYVTLTEASGAAPEQHLTVALKGNSSTLYTVGGTVGGLTGTGMSLRLNGGSDLPVSTDGPFTFVGGLYSGASYNVTVGNHPTDQICNVTNGSGTVGGSNVTDVSVNCIAANYYKIGGQVTGLNGTGLSLKLNGTYDLPIAAGGDFTFVEKVLDGATYNVTIGTQPVGQTCLVNAGSGTVAGADVDSVQVVCSDAFYTVGGTVSGLLGPGLKLKLNDGAAKSIPGNGSFVFTNQPLTNGLPYEVTVSAQPNTTPAQTCTVINGSGEIPAADVRNVQVVCAVPTVEIFKNGFE